MCEMADVNNRYPDPFVFEDGRAVNNASDWQQRADELRGMYERCMYGTWREGEQVTFSISDSGAQIFTVFGTAPAEGAKNLTVTVEYEGRTTSWSVPVFLPDRERCPMPEGGYPYLLCMHDIMPRQTALENGYAVIVVNTVEIAADSTARTGRFYEVHPYSDAPEEQTGVLMAWSWGISKVIDAIYAGADRELGLNREYSLVTGVSRWGKATAVCGGFDRRIRMVIPACSGAGGLALYRYKSEGRTYDLSSKGAPAEYTYSTNEPLGSLTSEGERGWFNDAFLQYTEPAQIPLEQYMLAALCADPARYYFVIGACISEDWVNAPSMWACYKAAHKVYDMLGLDDHLVCNFHREGHAVTEEDMRYIVAYFDHEVRGIGNGSDISAIRTSVYAEPANTDPAIEAIWAEWRA